MPESVAWNTPRQEAWISEWDPCCPDIFLPVVFLQGLLGQHPHLCPSPSVEDRLNQKLKEARS